MFFEKTLYNTYALVDYKKTNYILYFLKIKTKIKNFLDSSLQCPKIRRLE